MAKKTLPLVPAPIEFGTDGWRGILGVDFTLERLLPVAIAAAQELAYFAPENLNSRTVIIGYDRRFMASEMAEAIASAVRSCELEPLLTNSPVVTPACSWAVTQRKALGALVITASHNPPEWLGLKIKGPLGGSVEKDFTNAVEKRLAVGGVSVPIKCVTDQFDCRDEHLKALSKKFNIPLILRGLKELGVTVIVDPMHGSAAGCLKDLLSDGPDGIIKEIRSERDPLFGGNPPEPLANYINQLIDTVKSFNNSGKPSIGLVFDGDGDRIAAVDEQGRYCSTQLLIPFLINYLASHQNKSGCIVKTVSGCDLMRLVAESYGREVLELPVGFKYIASEMLSKEVLIGGEESGGIGFGDHIPERDALFTCLVLLEAISNNKKLIGKSIDELQESFGEVHYDRIDLYLENMDLRNKFENFLKQTPPKNVLGKKVKEVISIDGIKLRLDEKYWLMFRFSGTEPLLRIYCEGRSREEVKDTLFWSKELLSKV